MANTASNRALQDVGSARSDHPIRSQHPAGDQSSPIGAAASISQALQAASTARLEGDALFTGLSTVTLWNLLVAAGVLPRQRALSALDAALLTLEQRRETWNGDIAIIDQARTRMESLIGQLKIVPD